MTVADKFRKIARKFIREGFRRFPDDEVAASAWAMEHIEEQLRQMDAASLHAFLPLIAADVVQAAQDAFEMFPHDEEAAMGWMRETRESRGAPPSLEAIYRRAYQDARAAKESMITKETTP